jgi:hypothetical protein
MGRIGRLYLENDEKNVLPPQYKRSKAMKTQVFMAF